MKKGLKIDIKKIKIGFVLIFFLLIIALLVNVLVVKSRATVGDIEKGLIGHWFLDGEHGAKDVTPYGNHAVISGATLTAGIKGEGEGAYDFSSTSNYVTIPNTTSINIESFSISLWTYYRNYAYPRTFGAIKKSSPNCFTAGGLGWDFGHGYNSSGVDVCINDGIHMVRRTLVLNSGNQPTNLLNKWSHITYVVNRNLNKVLVYVNGVKQNDEVDISTVTGSIKNSANLVFGTLYGWYTDGLITDVRMYNRAISAYEAKAIYERYQPSLGASSLNKGLVAHYSLNKENEGNGSIILATNFSSGSSGWNYTANVNWSSGKPNMNGVASDSYIITSSNVFVANKTYRVIVDCTVVSGSALASPQMTTSSSMLLNHTGKYEYTVTTPTDQRFLIDNVSNTDVNMTINSVYISEVSVNDTSPNINNGKVFGATLTTDRKGKVNGAYSFDGVNDYIEIVNDTTKILGNNPSEWSYSAWFKTNGVVTGKKEILSNYYSSGTDGLVGIWTGINGNGDTGQIFINVRGSGGVEYKYTTNDYRDSKWHNITVSIKKGGFVRGYIDGELFTDTVLGSDSYIDNAPLRIGVLTVSSTLSEFWSGSISDVKIYNRAISAQDAKLLYDSFNSKISIGTLNKGLILNMPLTNDYMKSSSIVSDATPYENDGNISGVTVNETESIFNGTGSNLNISSHNISLTNKFTVSAWLKFNEYSYMQLLNLGGFQFKWRIAGNYPYWNLYNSSGVHLGSLGYNTIPAINTWNHYVFSYDGTTRKIYLNGVLNTSAAATGNILVNPDFVFAGSGEVFKGSMSGVRLYNRVLSDSEIKLLYDKGRN